MVFRWFSPVPGCLREVFGARPASKEARAYIEELKNRRKARSLGNDVPRSTSERHRASCQAVVRLRSRLVGHVEAWRAETAQPATAAAIRGWHGPAVEAKLKLEAVAGSCLAPSLEGIYRIIHPK